MPTMTHTMEEYLYGESDSYLRRPTVEEGHTKRCLASAMIAAVQNYRDDDGVSDFDFSSAAQSNVFTELAYDYLNESELSDCLCPQKSVEVTANFRVAYTAVRSDELTSYPTYGTLSDVIAEAAQYVSSDECSWVRTYDQDIVWMSLNYGRLNDLI